MHIIDTYQFIFSRGIIWCSRPYNYTVHVNLISSSFCDLTIFSDVQLLYVCSCRIGGLRFRRKTSKALSVSDSSCSSVSFELLWILFEMITLPSQVWLSNGELDVCNCHQFGNVSYLELRYFPMIFVMCSVGAEMSMTRLSFLNRMQFNQYEWRFN